VLEIGSPMSMSCRIKGFFNVLTNQGQIGAVNGPSEMKTVARLETGAKGVLPGMMM
jgi:hypothetical protein